MNFTTTQPDGLTGPCVVEEIDFSNAVVSWCCGVDDEMQIRVKNVMVKLYRSGWVALDEVAVLTETETQHAKKRRIGK